MDGSFQVVQNTFRVFPFATAFRIIRRTLIHTAKDMVFIIKHILLYQVIYFFEIYVIVKLMIPIRDRNPTHSWPIVTVLLIIGNIYVFVKHNMSMNQHQLATMFSTYGAVPKQILSPENIDHLKVGIVSLFTSMFLHGGILHVGGNMLYLWIFGDNVEDRLGHLRFFFFYIFCGLGAAMTHIILMGQSTIPMVGASGAISGVLGAYLIAFPRVRVLTIIPIFIFIKLAELPAIVVLGFWFVIQFLNGYYSLQHMGAVNAAGVAWFSHVGGFLLGVLGILMLKKRMKK